MDFLTRHIRRLVGDTSITKIEVSAAPPFVKIVFERIDLQFLLQQGQSVVSNVVAKAFLRHRVFWLDLSKEDFESSVKSMENVECELDNFSLELEKNSSVAALAKFVVSWSTQVSVVRRNLVDRYRDIADEKATVLGYDSAGEDRVEALYDAVVALRQLIYPIVATLIAFLPDDDPTKQQAQLYLDSGLNVVPDAQLQRGCMPVVDEVVS